MDGSSAPKSFFARSSRRKTAGGFTITEVVIAGTVLAIFAIGGLVALTQINRWATNSRLRTLALALAQQRIDEALTAPWQLRTNRPDVLTIGKKEEKNLQLNNDAYNEASGLSSAFTKLDTPVTATRTTTVTEISPRLARVVVTVDFEYRRRPTVIRLQTLRTTDNF